MISNAHTHTNAYL